MPSQVNPQQLSTIRCALRQVPAFVAHSFAGEDSATVGLITDFLTNLGFTCDSGLQPEATQIPEKIIRRIERAEVFVGIFTRRQPKGDGTFTTAPWLIEEKAVAVKAGKTLLLFVEDGVETDYGGLQGSQEYIPFSRKNLAPALVKAIPYVLPSATVPLTCRVDPVARRIEIKIGEQPQPQDLEKQIEALRAEKIKNPENVQAAIALAGLLEPKDRREAIHEMEEVVRRWPAHSEAHHQLAHFYQNDNQLDKALSSFQRALELVPSHYKNNRCYGRALFQKAVATSELTSKRELLAKSKRLLDRAGQIGGEPVWNEVSHDLFLVEEELRQFAEVPNPK